jgi:hypothetical protein
MTLLVSFSRGLPGSSGIDRFATARVDAGVVPRVEERGIFSTKNRPVENSFKHRWAAGCRQASFVLESMQDEEGDES